MEAKLHLPLWRPSPHWNANLALHAPASRKLYHSILVRVYNLLLLSIPSYVYSKQLCERVSTWTGAVETLQSVSGLISDEKMDKTTSKTTEMSQ